MAASFPCSCTIFNRKFDWKDDQVYGTFLISGWWFTYPSSKHRRVSRPRIQSVVILCLVPSLYNDSFGTTNQVPLWSSAIHKSHRYDLRHSSSQLLSDGWQGARHILSPSYAATCWAVGASLRVPGVPRVPPSPRPSNPGCAAPASAPLQTPRGQRPPRLGPPAKPLKRCQVWKKWENTLKDPSYDSYD